MSNGRRKWQAAEEERKKTLYGEEVVKLHYKNSRFLAASLIHEVLENQAHNPESIREGIISYFPSGWSGIYDMPLDVEFWEFAFKQGIPREKVQNFRRPSDHARDWPAWVEKIKKAQAAGEPLGRFGLELNRVYSVPSPELGKMLLDPESPTRKGWEDPERQRLAALVDRMIAETDWPAWPNEPDWETLVNKYIISEIPDLIEKAIERTIEKDRKQQEQLRLLIESNQPEWHQGP